MAKVRKPSIHAPWRKRNLIPLWFFQLSLVGYQFAWSLTVFSLGFSGSVSGLRPYEKASAGITMVLGLIITAIIIVSIIKFSKFRLTSLDYKRETIWTVVLGVVSTVFVFSACDVFGGIFVGMQVLFSIWLMVYAIRVRRNVLKGTVGEMTRPVKSAAKAQVDVELGNSRTASTPVEPLPSYQPPPYEGSGQKHIVGSVSATTRPSQSSVATGGESASLKEMREFV